MSYENDADLALQAVDESAQHNVTQVAKDLKVSVSSSAAEVHREIAKCFATLSNRLSAVKAAGSEVATTAKNGADIGTSEGIVNKDANSVVDSNKVRVSIS